MLAISVCIWLPTAMIIHVNVRVQWCVQPFLSRTNQSTTTRTTIEAFARTLRRHPHHSLWCSLNLQRVSQVGSSWQCFVSCPQWRILTMPPICPNSPQTEMRCPSCGPRQVQHMVGHGSRTTSCLWQRFRKDNRSCHSMAQRWLVNQVCWVAFWVTALQKMVGLKPGYCFY